MTPPATLALAIAVALAAAPAVGPPPASPGQQPPPTTFRSATALVEVDIIVKDKDGHFVSGLTSDDFEVLEDGHPQKVQHFYLVTEHAPAPSAPQSVVMVPRSPDQVERRAFVLYFDTDHLSASGLARLKQAAMSFVGASNSGRAISAACSPTARSGTDI